MYATISSTLGATYMFKQQPQPRVHLLNVEQRDFFAFTSHKQEEGGEKGGSKSNLCAIKCDLLSCESPN